MTRISKLAALCAAILLALPASAQTFSMARAEPHKPVVLKDRQMNARDHFTFYVNPFGSTSLPSDAYANSMVIQSNADPLKFTISHRYAATFKNGVRGYNAVQFGAGKGARPLKPWPARQVKNMAGVHQDFSLRFVAKGDFNILAETFVVRSATDEGAGLLEIGFQLHQNKPLWDFVKYGKGRGIGQFDDRYGRKWQAVLMPGARDYIMFIPVNGDALCCSLDVGGALLFLKRRGFLTGEEWVRGWYFGVEPVNGSATVYVDRLTGLIGG